MSPLALCCPAFRQHNTEPITALTTQSPLSTHTEDCSQAVLLNKNDNLSSNLY